MRKFLLFAIIGGLGALFVVQKQKEFDAKAAASHSAPASASNSVSEHDWAKHSLDRASEVKRQVLQQRKEDGVVSR